MNEHSFQHYLLGLIAVANNIPAIPLYLELCQELEAKEQHKLCLIATMTAFITMMTAMFTGIAILNFFDISIDAFRIAGGLLLVNTGLAMMSSSQQVVVQKDGASFSGFSCPPMAPSEKRRNAKREKAAICLRKALCSSAFRGTLGALHLSSVFSRR